MADTNPALAMVRAFCGLDASADTTVLEMCYKAAVKWYEKAGVPTPAEEENTDDYAFWVCNLAAYFYDSRGARGDDAKVPPYILASLHQLRPIPETETSV